MYVTKLLKKGSILGKRTATKVTRDQAADIVAKGARTTEGKRRRRATLDQDE